MRFSGILARLGASLPSLPTTATPVSTVTVMVARLWTAAAVVVTLSQHWLDAAALDNGLARTPALGKHSA
jgi:hypothetical protein